MTARHAREAGKAPGAGEGKGAVPGTGSPTGNTGLGSRTGPGGSAGQAGATGMEAATNATTPADYAGIDSGNLREVAGGADNAAAARTSPAPVLGGGMGGGTTLGDYDDRTPDLNGPFEQPDRPTRA